MERHDVAPVEYAVAVDWYLAQAALAPASRRVYRISLTSWAWPLVGKSLPPGARRRGAAPPVVPLAMLDDGAAAARIKTAVANRMRSAGVPTASRELSALRGAVGWWQDRGWISGDPTAGLRGAGDRAAGPLPALTPDQLAALWRCPAGLREQAFWHLLHDSGAPAIAVLALDADRLDLAARRARPGSEVTWRAGTGDLLAWLLAGRRHGPVFLTDRRAPACLRQADVCPLTGRARMSYRRAAEIFAEHTRRLDPDRAGWTLRQLTEPAARR